MLKELKFVQGAVAKKEFIPAITHFCIEGGTVRAYNGTIALSSPIACDLTCKPLAVPMVQAIAKCRDTITMSMTPTGRLSIKSGAFRALIPCANDELQAHVEPEGDTIEFDGAALVQALKAVEPFIGNDASRPWATGVLLCGQSAYATNNVCVIEYWVGATFPRVVNLPRAAVREMLRLGEGPIGAQVTANSITFHYSDGRWLRSQLFNTDWPDMKRILDQPCAPTRIPDDVFIGIENLKPFADKMGRLIIRDGVMHTHEDIGDGAAFESEWCKCPEDQPLEGVRAPSVFNIHMFALLEGVATSADFTRYPDPTLFFGERLRGAMTGLRL